MTYGKKIIVSMLLIFVAISIDAMDVFTISNLSSAKANEDKLRNQDAVFVYDENTGIVISKEIFFLSKVMKNAMQDLPGELFFPLKYQTVYIFRLLRECGLNVEMFEKI